MSGNTFGSIFRITTFGESHGSALGAVIDGCPAGVPINKDRIQEALNRRKPGSTAGTSKNVTGTTRSESDEVQILSGVFENISTGTPIALVIENKSQKSHDYSNIQNLYRPGHADYTYQTKYGIRDYRGGGRSSGRETAARVAGGAVARMMIEAMCAKEPGVIAYTKEAAGIKCRDINLSLIEKNQMRAPDSWAAEKMLETIETLKHKGDSAGGIIECIITGIPAGLGEPVFDKLDAELAKAMLSIGAVKAIEFGAGFESARMTGSQWNDSMCISDNSSGPLFLSNNAGGILGGISNGNDIVFRLAVKPVPSILQTQKTVNTLGQNCDIFIEGRHDICICPRVVPVVEAMAYLTLADMLLREKSSRI